VLRTASVANPTAYRLLRVGLYLHLATPPPADAGGKTQIPGFPPNRRQQLGLMQANAKWEALIEEAESGLMQFRFCLDLHRVTWEALDKLGEPFAAARDVVAAEVGALVRRMPALVGYSAVDGSPLADKDTKSWLAAVASAGDGGGASASDGGDDLPEARALLVAGKGTEALALARQAIESTGSPRRRFARRLALAFACLDTGNALLARGMFAALDREIQERGLSEWEPELVGRTLDGFVRSIRAAAKTGAKYEGADAVFERLCLVDPAAAARLANPG
jgi:type VI secretion system protein VasJ